MKKRFELEVTPRFSKLLKALSRDAQSRVLREVRLLEVDHHLGKPIRGDFKGVYSMRVGDYRVLYELAARRVVLLTVDHRRHVYGEY
ncbi:MAG: type II toxin-antitoxin system RelE/ParE family toxin [Candidatus Bathyarchaeota archaeon]|nr:type II toxin-antitoxin system RelE/ParE family toxin [Candidatus Bathyarchaeota archaeon]